MLPATNRPSELPDSFLLQTKTAGPLASTGQPARAAPPSEARAAAKASLETDLRTVLKPAESRERDRPHRLSLLKKWDQRADSGFQRKASSLTRTLGRAFRRTQTVKPACGIEESHCEKSHGESRPGASRQLSRACFLGLEPQADPRQENRPSSHDSRTGKPACSMRSACSKVRYLSGSRGMQQSLGPFGHRLVHRDWQPSHSCSAVGFAFSALLRAGSTANDPVAKAVELRAKGRLWPEAAPLALRALCRQSSARALLPIPMQRALTPTAFPVPPPTSVSRPKASCGRGSRLKFVGRALHVRTETTRYPPELARLKPGRDDSGPCDRVHLEGITIRLSVPEGCTGIQSCRIDDFPSDRSGVTGVERTETPEI